MNYMFLKYHNNCYAGESSPYYEIIAETNDENIARMINNSIPYRNDKNNILCLSMFNVLVGYQPYTAFNYDFTPTYDEIIEIR